jgi:thioredoxin 1
MSETIVALDAQGFEAHIAKGEGLALVDFWAAWCGPCKMITPILEALQKELKGVSFYKMDIDDQGNIPVLQEHNIMSVPTLILFRDGAAVGTLIGLHPQEKIKAFIEEHQSA